MARKLKLSDWTIVHIFFSSRRRHTRYWRDWSSDVCSSDLILLEPFIPFSCEKIWSQLKLGNGDVHQQVWETAKDIRAIPPGHELGKVQPIFRKIEAKEIEQWKNKLGKPQ